MISDCGRLVFRSSIAALLLFRRAVVFRPQKFPGTWPPFFLKTKMRTYVVVMVTVSFYHRFFSVIPLLPRNTTIINQSNLRNFLA